MKKLTLLLIAGLCFSVSVGAQTLQENKEIERAKAFVKSKGLTWGGQGDYGTKGLYTYDQSNSRYYGKAYFGIGGNKLQQSATVKKPKERIPGWLDDVKRANIEDSGLGRTLKIKPVKLPKPGKGKLTAKKPLAKKPLEEPLAKKPLAKKPLENPVPVITVAVAAKRLADLVGGSLTDDGNGNYTLVSNIDLTEDLIIESNETLFINTNIKLNISANVHNKGIVFLTGNKDRVDGILNQTTINNYGVFVNEGLIQSSNKYEYFYNKSGGSFYNLNPNQKDGVANQLYNFSGQFGSAIFDVKSEFKFGRYNYNYGIYTGDYLENPLAKKPLAKKPLAKKPLAKKPLAKKPLENPLEKPLAKKPLAKKPLAKTQTTNDPQLELRRRKSEEGLDRINNIAEAVLAPRLGKTEKYYGPYLLNTTKRDVSRNYTNVWRRLETAKALEKKIRSENMNALIELRATTEKLRNTKEGAAAAVVSGGGVSLDGLDRIDNIAEAVLAHDRNIYGPYLLDTTEMDMGMSRENGYRKNGNVWGRFETVKALEIKIGLEDIKALNELKNIVETIKENL